MSPRTNIWRPSSLASSALSAATAADACESRPSGNCNAIRCTVTAYVAAVAAMSKSNEEEAAEILLVSSDRSITAASLEEKAEAPDSMAAVPSRPPCARSDT